jgi:hypothetical protein
MTMLFRNETAMRKGKRWISNNSEPPRETSTPRNGARGAASKTRIKERRAMICERINHEPHDAQPDMNMSPMSS